MSLPLVLALLVFCAVALAIFSFGAAAYAPSSVIGSRLRSLGQQQRAQAQADKPAIKERIEQALDPLSKELPMSPDEVSRARTWLIQAGYRESRHVTFYLGVRVALAVVGLFIVILVGSRDPMLLIGVPALGFFIPRFLLKRMIRDRQMR